MRTPGFRWNRKPECGRQLDWTHPLTRGIVGCWLCNDNQGSDLVDLARRKTAIGGSGAAASSPTWKDGAANYSGTQWSVASPTQELQGAANWSMVLRCSSTVQASAAPAFAFGVNTSTYGPILIFYPFDTAGAGGGARVYSNSTAQITESGVNRADGKPHDFVVTRSSAANGTFVLYVDGVQTGVNAAGGGAGTLSSSLTAVGIGCWLANYQTFTGKIQHAMAFNRVLSAAEAASFHVDPYQIIQPPNVRRFWSGISLSQIAGTSGFSFGSTASLQGSAALAGSSAANFNASASIAATGLMIGASGFAVAASASITGKGAASGSSGLSIGAAGSLAGSGNIAGSTGISFDGSGQAKGFAAIAGSSGVSIGASGSIKGSGAIAGATGLSVSTTGALKGNGSLAGSSGVSIGASANLSGLASMAGASGFSLGAAGIITGSGNIAGASGITLSGSGQLQGKGALAGGSGLTFGSTGVITGRAAMVATAGFSFGASGILNDASQNIVFLPLLRSGTYLQA